jgi:hypothetical protein
MNATITWQPCMMDNEEFIFGPTSKCSRHHRLFLNRLSRSRLTANLILTVNIFSKHIQLHENVAKNISLPSISARQEEEEEAKDKEEDIDDDQSETNTSECSQIERIVTIDEDEDMDADDEIGTETTLSRAGTSCSFQSTAILLDKEQLNPKLYTLSGLATSRWQGLPLLELIRQRNKPKEPPKKPISAPFFMPTMDNAGGAIQFDKANLERLKEAERNEEQVQEKRHIAVAQRRFASSEKSEWIQSLLR